MPRAAKPKRPGAGTHRTGRPRQQAVITDAERATITKMLAEGHTEVEISRALKVSTATIHFHVTHHIRPRLLAAFATGPEYSLAKLQHLQRVAWEEFWRDDEMVTATQVRQTLNKKSGKLKITDRVTRDVPPKGSSRVAWASILLRLQDRERQLLGHNRPIQVHVTTTDDFRVAGVAPGEVDRMAVARMKMLLEQRELLDAAMRGKVVEALPDGER